MGINISFHLPVKMVPIKISSPEDVGNVLFSHGHLPEGVRKRILLFSEGFPPQVGISDNDWQIQFFPNISSMPTHHSGYGVNPRCWPLIIPY